ncbi:LacI family DNA-binding transcriptional regulator [Marivirga harenae]|uniref:LacI family DNA-binding transcriptional regulator n=1 Tax=Marivirga harenae TaxID=2010992 RepID=UPI0026DFD79D|nr:LacI family DNA-binding transcriptional regulator [Marivirga harenae]WKV11171.1 LacI family DNA-binding transcriptional regulator [Marivirga harenae]|tara:strand:- start:31569 stop:32603 length:1035 start_codon:yes stop_codon:yes gene_type:complete
MSKHNIRLKDIAEELGISIPSVSRALNNKPDIGIETKKKVFELAEKLNYQRNQFAINFKNQQSFIIGVIIPQIVHHFFSNVISGIINEAEKRGYSIMLFQSNESFESELKGVETFQKSMIDGLIISLSDNTNDVSHLKYLQEHNVPVILIDKITDELTSAKIICDDFKGAYFATEHLISLGKKKIAHITGSLNPYTTKERYRGYKSALKDYGLGFNEKLVKKCNLVSREEGYTTTLALLAENEIPDAIFCATDPTAIGAIKAIKEKGLRIPFDIAVMGFSDWKMSSVVEPPLSSVSQPDYEMGKKAVELITEEIHLTRANKPIKYETFVMETSLVIRESTMGKR